MQAELEELRERRRLAFKELAQERCKLTQHALDFPDQEADWGIQLRVLALIESFVQKHFD